MSIPDFIPLDQFRNLDWMSSRFPRPDRASYIKELQQNISNVQALLGLPEGARNMGIFDGDIIPDNTTLKVVLQSLEDALVDVYAEAPVVASEAEAEAGTDNRKVMTPLRTHQAISSLLDPAIAEVLEQALNRANHTGTQSIGTITGLTAALLGQRWVTPEQFSAQAGTGGDDTAAIQAALDTGKPVHLSGNYLTTGNTLGVDRQIVMLTGKLTKAPNTIAVLLTVAADDVCLINLGGLITDFNRTATGSVNTANPTQIVLTNVNAGTIRWYNQDGYAKGTAVYGAGLLPGTRIIGGPTATGGTNGTYTLDRAQPATWAGEIQFMDADSFWWANNSILVNGARFVGMYLDILGAAGNGMEIRGRESKLIHPEIRWATDNCLVAIGPDCGDFVWDTPKCYGSGWQNTIFVTAGDQEAGSSNYVNGGHIHNPTGLYAGDTALELGFHSKDIKVTGVARLDSHFSCILLRDTYGCSVEGAICYDFMDHITDWSPVAVVPSVEAATWMSYADIKGVQFYGKPDRAFAYIGQSGVRLHDCVGETYQDTPANYAQNFVVLAGAVTDIEVFDNKAHGYVNAVHTNWGIVVGNTVSRITVKDNLWASCTRSLYAPETVFVDCFWLDNLIKTSELTATHDLSSATYAPSGTPPKINLTVDDIRQGTAVSGSDVPGDQFSPRTAVCSGMTVDRKAGVRVCPETATNLAYIGNIGAFLNKMIRVWLSDGSESAYYFITATGAKKISGTDNFTDSLADSVGWGLGDFYESLVIRRNAGNTGVTGRFVLWSFVG